MKKAIELIYGFWKLDIPNNTKYNANIVMYVLKQEYKLEKTLEIY